MGPRLLLSLGVALVVATGTVGDEKDLQPSSDSYVKVRVEVEMRGVLQVTEEVATISARDRLYNRYNDAEEITDETRATVYTLDFARAKNLHELAKVLNGREVVAVGMSELRMVNVEVRPGGFTGGGFHLPFPSPTWSLQRTVLVTSLTPAADK